MKNNILLFLIFFPLFCFNGCFGLRSAEGLKEGELNVNYIAPIAGSVRYGLTENVETRLLYIGTDDFYYDLYLHTNDAKNFINGGITAGVSYSKYRQPNYYAGFTLGKKISENFSPYTSYLFHRYAEENQYRSFEYLALGTEISFNLWKNGKYKFLLTPEFRFSRDKHLFNTPFTFSAGIIVNFN